MYNSNHFEDAALLYSEVFDVLTKDYLYPPDLKAGRATWFFFVAGCSFARQTRV
jgi:hypothetical protein